MIVGNRVDKTIIRGSKRNAVSNIMVLVSKWVGRELTVLENC